MDSISHIKVRSAKEHNLKAMDVDIPRDKLVVLTGLFGQEVILAFDTPNKKVSVVMWKASQLMHDNF